MKELQQRQKTSEEMSATILSAFYDIDMLYKQDKVNMNALHINSLLDRKAVGAPLSSNPLNPNPSPGSNTSCSSFAPGSFFRRNSTSNMDQSLTNNGNKYTVNSYSSNLKESSSATALMNKENKFRDRAYSENGAERGGLGGGSAGLGGGSAQQQLQQLQQQKQGGSQINSTRYKTELCRPFEENGACKYGEKCQFAHGYHELRSLSRHPKYKTEPCRTFHTIGFCPYGPRCHFIHNADERRPSPPSCNANMPGGEVPKSARELCGYGPRGDGCLTGQGSYNQRERPKLHHSLSFSGFSSHHGLDSPLLESPTSRTPPPSSSSSSSCSPNFYEDVLSPNSMSCVVNSAFSFPGSQQDLKALLAPLAAVHAAQTHGYASSQSNGAYYGNLQHATMCPPSPTSAYNMSSNMSHLQALRRLSESPVFDSPACPPSPPSPPDSLSDRDSYGSGSLSSSGSLSGSESPSLDAGRRLPIFSRLSISDD